MKTYPFRLAEDADEVTTSQFLEVVFSPATSHELGKQVRIRGRILQTDRYTGNYNDSLHNVHQKLVNYF